MNKILLLSAFLFIMSGCSNPYTQFYTDYTGGINVLDDPKFIVGTGEPRVLQGSIPEQDEQRMLEDGYILLGASSFNGADVDHRDAIGQAKKVHADTVITYTQHTETLSGSIPLTLPDTQTTFHSGSIYSSGVGRATFSGSSTTYGTTTTYMPYHVRRYDYLATFWLKAKLRLGLYFRDLTPEERKSMGTNKGTCIAIVVKNSPAFEADLVPGDIIRKLNGVEIVDGNHFLNALDSRETQTIRLEISRQGKKIVKEVTLSESGYAADRDSVSKSSKPAELRSDIGTPEREAELEPEPQADTAVKIIRGYKLKRDASGEPAKDKDGSFIFVPVYE